MDETNVELQIPVDNTTSDVKEITRKEKFLSYFKNNFLKISIILLGVALFGVGIALYKYFSIYNSSEFVLRTAVNKFNKHHKYSYTGSMTANFVDSDPDKEDIMELEYVNISTDNFTQEHYMQVVGVYEKSEKFRMKTNITWNQNEANEAVFDLVFYDDELYWKIEKFFDEGLVKKEALDSYLKVNFSQVGEAFGFENLRKDLENLLDVSRVTLVETLPQDVIGESVHYHYKIDFETSEIIQNIEINEVDIWVSKPTREITKIKGDFVVKGFGSDSKYLSLLTEISFLEYDKDEPSVASPSSFIEL